MIELYGNKIWNSNTPNKYKKVIIASEDSLDNICQELENSGLNYCAYIFNGEAHIAIGRLPQLILISWILIIRLLLNVIQKSIKPTTS